MPRMTSVGRRYVKKAENWKGQREMLADLGGNALVNTNEIRRICVQCVNYGTSKRWDVFVYMIQDGIYESISSHATEAEALENLERVRAILRDANCMIDLSIVNNKNITPIA